MENLVKSLFLVVLLSVLGSCERVKDKEAVAALPDTSTEDTLVVTPDTLEIDTTLSEEGAMALNEGQTQSEPQAGAASGTASLDEAVASRSVSSNGSTASANETGGSSATKVTTTNVSKSSAGSSEKTGTARKRYVRPTQKQLQQALAVDARRSNQMSLPQLKNYWQKRQHYYRRASKEVKYVAGDTKIKISPEETKIETKLGKVKMEGNDIKVKYD
ncbi:hypothetical protein [Sabulibacter ruber]|uniref:hypothetical protein n=1 Tax=Sabulibacter ruber TaxID=2811901 RepID=UPI001A9663CC|nr:hypothetical protein [Sabulibacter ruber]